MSDTSCISRRTQVHAVSCFDFIFSHSFVPFLSVARAVGWQWANQSYNVLVNYSNANKNNALNMTQLLTAYGAAVSTSCALAVGFGTAVRRGEVF